MKVKNTVLLFISLPITTNIALSFDSASMTVGQTNQLINIDEHNSTLDTNDRCCFNYSNCFEYLLIEEQVEAISNKIITLINKTIETNNENDLLQFIESKKNDIYFLHSISSIFSDTKYISIQLYFINILLASDIEIFDCWYKLALTIASKSESLSLALRAQDILDYYSEDFAPIDISNALN